MIMNKLLKTFFVVVVIAVLSEGFIVAQVKVNKIAQAGMKFLSVSAGARGVGMGDAFLASANNSEAMFWNAAGITQVKKEIDVSMGYNKWIADITHQYLGAVYNADEWGVFGVHLIYVDYGELEGTRRSDLDPKGYVETGNFSPSALVAGLSYARSISDKFSFGVNIKYVYQDLGSGYVSTGTTTEEYKTVENKLGEFAFDIGTLYYTGFKDLRLAMNIANISLEKGFVRETFPLPITLKFGIAMDVLKLFNIDPVHQLTLAVDALHLRDYSERLHVGAEYSFNETVALRAGYKFNYDEDKFSAGFGVKIFKDIRLDYAYSPFTTLESVHRISLGYEL
jgi:hypothetical protein